MPERFLDFIALGATRHPFKDHGAIVGLHMQSALIPFDFEGIIGLYEKTSDLATAPTVTPPHRHPGSRQGDETEAMTCASRKVHPHELLDVVNPKIGTFRQQRAENVHDVAREGRDAPVGMSGIGESPTNDVGAGHAPVRARQSLRQRLATSSGVRRSVASGTRSASRRPSE